MTGIERFGRAANPCTVPVMKVEHALQVRGEGNDGTDLCSPRTRTPEPPTTAPAAPGAGAPPAEKHLVKGLSGLFNFSSGPDLSLAHTHTHKPI